ncbi:MAG TPA: Clp protease N-terminal domain-containing protein [Acidimicrobiales bacterium]
MAEVQLEDPILLAWSVADSMGDEHVGVEHLFVALLHGRPDATASEVLLGAGLDAEQLEAWLRAKHSTTERRQDDAHHDKPETSFWGRTIHPTPILTQTIGFAEGFAAAHQAAAPASTDLLVALLWDDRSRVGAMLRTQNLTREAIVAALVEQGLPLPIAALPPLPLPWHGMHRADIPRESLRTVLDALKDRHPPGSEFRWGFNANGESTWIIAEAGIDLRTLVVEVTGELPLRQSTVGDEQASAES